MYSPKTFFKGISNTLLQHFSNEVNPIEIQKALVVSKLSRYEYERNKHKNLTDKELQIHLRKRGTDVEKLIHFYDLQKKFEDNVANTLRDMGIDVEVVNRLNCNEDMVKEADVVLPTGGDGTFLLAASRVLDNKKPVVGFNSDPTRSEGYLCLPKRYSSDIRGAIERLQKGCFEWLMRSRIRTTLVVSEEENLVPKYLHDTEGDCDALFKVKTRSNGDGGKVLPVLALNEVFVGESLSARVSHLQMRLNGSTENTNLKCSGVCVSTGTGSTSWHLSMNRLPIQSVAELLKLLDIEATEDKNSLAAVLSDIYNKNLIFAPDDINMGYTIRDLISAGVWPQPKGIKSRGFAKKIEIKSNCFDACLVVDGGVSFCFNDGTIALLEVLPEDALRTVVFKD
ncbi:NAD kinase 2, mitochondrial isoform X2 [Leptinotarsa decemlineata]|uniref:NAD kinase 2, mitochondrial isoform X2 n=1 Tax=Leptinotarsa decemlineata TaxID=7539 RepID=UPI003D309CE9